jgi:hypothetical protein
MDNNFIAIPENTKKGFAVARGGTECMSIVLTKNEEQSNGE